jgi:hypothetical protein
MSPQKGETVLPLQPNLPVSRPFSMREPGRQKNGQVQVEALVRALLEPLARRERQKLLGLLEEEATH